MTPGRHGTASGHTRHLRRGERPCEACVRAGQQYDARWRSAPERVRRNRLAARAQNRAYTELAHAHRDEYQRLYKRHLAELTAEAEASA